MPSRRRTRESLLSRDVRQHIADLLLMDNSLGFKVTNEEPNTIRRQIYADEGVLAGVPDWTFIQAVTLDPETLGRWSEAGETLRLCRVVMPELKGPGGRPSDDQTRVQGHLRERCNVITANCWSVAEVYQLLVEGGFRLKGTMS